MRPPTRPLSDLYLYDLARTQAMQAALFEEDAAAGGGRHASRTDAVAMYFTRAFAEELQQGSSVVGKDKFFNVLKEVPGVALSDNEVRA